MDLSFVQLRHLQLIAEAGEVRFQADPLSRRVPFAWVERHCKQFRLDPETVTSLLDRNLLVYEIDSCLVLSYVGTITSAAHALVTALNSEQTSATTVTFLSSVEIQYSPQ